MSRTSGGAADPHPRFGIEEEFFLLDRASGRAAPIAPTVIDRLPPGSRPRAQPEFLASQLEHATTICTSASAAREQLLEFRTDLATGVRDTDAIAAGVGAPFDAGDPTVLSPGSRYDELAARHGGIIDDHQVAALHVHIEIPDRETGVRALRALVGWLPFLKTISGNSPWWSGRDTGFASWRTILLRRWTTGGCPPAVADAAEYAVRASALVGIGGTRDEATVAWDVRLSTRYPTVELRAADAQLTADDALLVALLARGLVSATISRPDAPPDFDPELIDAACWHAARYGISDETVLPGESSLAPLSEALRALSGALDSPDDDMERIEDGLTRLFAEGTGADRQRAAALPDGWRSLSDHLSDALTHDRPRTRGAGMTGASDLDPDERREELLRAPRSDEGDAAPRITATPRPDGATRIDVADTAAVRPGGGTSGEDA